VPVPGESDCSVSGGEASAPEGAIEFHGVGWQSVFSCQAR
jgi:hypothetical protein